MWEYVNKKSQVTPPTPSFTYGTVESHQKTKADAIVGDICYYGETPIGVVVINGDETVKIMSLYWLNKNGEKLTNGVPLKWGEPDKSTGIIDENNGKLNTEKLVELGEEYEGAIACNLYSTEGTKQGDWYLPAKQEFLDMDWKNNKPKVEYSLQKLYSSKNASFSTLSYYDIQTSTELSSDGLRYIFWNASNRIYDSAKPGTSYVIAFCEL